MKKMPFPVVAVVVAAMVAFGFRGRPYDFAGYAVWLILIGIAVAGYALLKSSYYRPGTQWPDGPAQPAPLRITWLDYLRTAVSWLEAFKQTYAVAPGLFYSGASYDPGAPLLATSNYLMTVLLVARKARPFNARLLVIDTDGINVWCSAGKGRFCNDEILKQVARYRGGALPDDGQLAVILPKFSMAGVQLHSLRKAGVRPIIGPLHAADLPAYLSNPPLKDRSEDRVVFGIRMRVFSWLPGLVQYMGYAAPAALALFALNALWGISTPIIGLLGITAFLATAYPLLFPWIPGKRFAVKGLWLAAFTSVPLALSSALSPGELASAALFTFTASLFIGLSYTGNSAVSNYSRVRREIARFLPLNALLAVACLAAFIILEVGK